MRHSRFSAIALTLALFGCSDELDSSCPSCEIPTSAADLEVYLSAGEYLDFEAESEVHEGVGPHFGRVRTFINQELAVSLASGESEHPVGAAAVKELYGEGEDVAGYSVMVKTREGRGGDTWYWYEEYQGTLYADEQGDSRCTGCHSSGVDHFRSPFPLQ
jgi:hypothetical protein